MITNINTSSPRVSPRPLCASALKFHEPESIVLCNPRMPESERMRYEQELSKAPVTPGHVWVSTSGSSGHIKWVALSKAAIIASATAVNAFLESNDKDVWLNPLPSFHVGGLGIWARSHLSGAKVVECSWDPKLYHTLAHENKATLSSLVPAQVYDLVQQNLKAPPSLRAIIVGGGALAESLVNKGRERGWNLLPSYGLTENASQVATWRGNGLELLSHVEVRLSSSGCFEIRSPSLLSLYAFPTPTGMQYVDPKKDGWFTTEDQGSIQGKLLQITGRQGNFIKIGGESVDVSRLERILEEAQTAHHQRTDLALIPVPDQRLGHVIHLASAHPLEVIQPILDHYHHHVMPFEKIRDIHYLDSIPRTPLQKIIKSEILCRLNITNIN